MKNKGFTLIELLVVTALIGVLGVISAVVISSILRSQNKTAIINEVRQNGDLVISKFERDVKQASQVCITGGASCPGSETSVTLQTPTAPAGGLIWDCVNDFRRDGVSVINTDPTNGVEVESCSFIVSAGGGTTGVPQIVTLDFRLKQISDLGNQEFHISEPFRVTVGTRAY